MDKTSPRVMVSPSDGVLSPQVMVVGLPGTGKTQCCADLAALGMDFGSHITADYEDPTVFAVCRSAMRAQGVNGFRTQSLTIPFGWNSSWTTYLARTFIKEGFDNDVLPQLPQAFKNPCPGSVRTMLGLYPTIDHIVFCHRDQTPWVVLMKLYGVDEGELLRSYHMMNTMMEHLTAPAAVTMTYNIDKEEGRWARLKDFLNWGW